MKFLFIILCSISISVLLSDIQNIIWPSAPNFFTKSINDMIHKTSEEKLYVNYNITKYNFINLLNAFFSYNFNLFNLFKPGTGIYICFVNSIYVNIISITLFILFFLINAMFIYKYKHNLKSHKLYFGLLIALFSNFALHLVYGNSISFLYICHFNFLIILILGYIFNYLKLPNLFTKTFTKLLIILVICILSLRSVFIMIRLLLPVYNSIEYVRLLPLVIILAVSICLVFLYSNRRLVRIVLIGIFLILTFVVFKYINKNSYCNSNCNVIQIYQKKYDKYIHQLKEMKNTFNVSSYEDTSKEIGIYFFGMADRKKILYKQGKLIDLKNNKNIKNIEYKEELIVPNEYTVLLIDKDGNNFRIYENETGIYFEKNGEKEVIDVGQHRINLPNFDGYKYSEILKVLHQEILFNIDGDIPKPNLFAYKSAWYRDSMIATMVLEKTNNTHLLKNWVDDLTKIYDHSRSVDIDEVDNLGELLYIIGAVNPKRTDLINKVIKEIEKIKTDDKTIMGMVDGSVQSYYPTAIAIYGLNKVNRKLDLIVPQTDDGYAKLTWYMPPIATSTIQESKFYPYINWAFYHYAPYGPLYVLDEIYPLTYEGGDSETSGILEAECIVSEFYCNKQVFLSHMWHASEMFLFLIEQ